MAHFDIKEDEAFVAPRGRPADPGRLWLSVRHDWHWMPLGGLIWGVLGLIVAFVLIHATYRSHATLIWEPRNEYRPDERTLGNEIRALQQPAAIAKVRDQLKLAVPLNLLGQQFDVRFMPQSKLVSLTADAASADGALKLQRTVLDTFLEQQREYARLRAKAALAKLQEEAKSTRERREQAQAAYDALVAQDKPEPGKPNAAPGAQEKPDGDRAQGKGKNDARTKPTAPGTVTTGPGKPRPHSSLWRYLASPDDQGPKGMAKGGVPGAVDDTAAKARAEAERERQRSIADLHRNLQTLDAKLVESNRAIARAEAAIAAPSSDWRVLTPPTAARPEHATQQAIAIAMPVCGVLFGLLALLLRPITNGRVFTAREAAYWASLPVVASSAWPRIRDEFFPLVDELGLQAAGSGGTTLLVGITGAEKPLAEELAYWLGGETPARNFAGGSVSVGAPSGAATTVAGTGRGVSGGPEGVGVSTSQKPPETLVIFEPRSGLPRAGARVAVGVQGGGMHAWLGEVDGPALRRAARVADRVIVLVTSGSLTFTALSALRTRLGRTAGVALVMLNVGPTLLKLPDQAGQVGKFWRQTRR